MRFLIDSQLSPVLTAWVRERGQDADHIRGFALQRSDDDTIWRLALDLGCVVITKDYDFVEWASSRRPAPQVVWVRVGNATNRSLTARLDAAWDRIVADLEAGAQIVEVGRE